jgi:peptidoglycan-associated lipoprotein
MKKHALGLFLALSSAMLVSGGCAKREVVKKDEPVAPVATASVNPPVKAEAAKEQPVNPVPVGGHVEQDAPAPIPQAGELKAELEKIYFDFDSYKLSEAARANLVKNAEQIRKNPAHKVRIEGNCDERGSDEYNLALGERRAKAAAEYLLTMGVPAARLSVLSFGEEKPADPGHDEAAWANNRRDEFVIVSE